MPAKHKNSKPQSAMQMVVLRFREKGFAATVRASVRHMLRAVLTRLEVKDYGENADLQILRSDFALKAQAAARRGDWHNAGLFWQKELGSPAQPYIGLSEAAAAQGDMVRANAILRDSLTHLPDNALLLEAYCQLALKAKRWGEVTRRWQMIEDSGCLIDPKLKPPIVEAFLQIGDLDRAAALVADMRPALAETSSFLRMDALLAEAREEWVNAADLWLHRGKRVKGVSQTSSFERGVRALIRANDLGRAEDETQALVRKFPKTIQYAKLRAEVAIAQDAWAVALERWQVVEALDPAQAGKIPSTWIFRIGVDAARKRTEAIRIPRLQASGMLALASTIQSIDDVGALVYARRAHKFYPENVRELVAQVLATSSRHSASIWWVRRLLSTSKKPQRHYPTLVESLLQSSRLDECEAVLDDYLAIKSKDNLWLRAMMEIHYRRSNFDKMGAVMQEAVTGKFLISFKSLRVTRWIYDMIRLHPTPHIFLPEEIHDLVLRIANLYDDKFLSDSISMLLNPAQGDAAAEDYAAQITQAAEAGTEDAAMDSVLQEEMLQFFMRRRDWDQVEALLALPLPSELTTANVKKVWNIVRNKLDIQLGRGDVAVAEETAFAHLDRLKQADLKEAILQQAVGMVTRLPTSGRIISCLEETALDLGFVAVAERAKRWREEYADRDYSGLVGIARKERCFVVGNAPSIAQLPLHLLEGEDIICMNRGMPAMRLGLPKPKCLVVADPLVYKNHGQELDSDGASVESYFIGSNCLWRQPATVPAIPLGSSGLKLSLSPFQHVPWHLHRGDTVAILAASIAHLMGYREIYIIGVDLDYSGPVTHFYIKPGGGQKEVERLANFRPGGSGTELVNLSFANLQKVVEPDGCRLYNASLGGKLDSLERVNFYDVLGAPRPEDSGLNNDTEEQAA